jgi:hypothetical protein
VTKILKEYGYNDKFSKRLAIFCSDERFIRPTIAFLEKSLEITSCDIMVLPGGPEFIAKGSVGIIKRLELLTDAHNIQEIILISHEDCGYYKRIFKNDHPDSLYERQVTDMNTAIKVLKASFPNTAIKGYYCKIKDKKAVIFDSPE